MKLLLGVIWISMVARNKTKVFPGVLHLNIYTQKPLGLPNLVLNDNQNRVTTCYQIAIHNVTFGCSEKVFSLIIMTACLASIEPGKVGQFGLKSWKIWSKFALHEAYLLFLHGSISLSFLGYFGVWHAIIWIVTYIKWTFLNANECELLFFKILIFNGQLGQAQGLLGVYI